MLQGADAKWKPHAVRVDGAVRGGAPSSDGKSVFVWGEAGVFRVALKGGKVRRMAAQGAFDEPGCVAGNGLVLQRDGKIALLTGKQLESASVIDQGGEMADCLETPLLGEAGILITWRGLQVRHYRRPGAGEARWPYREIYSFYTASYQAGLVLRDVDGDGRPDLFCGNYWIQSPEAYELPWRLFAINTYNEEPQSARMRLAALNGGLAVAQGALPAGRITVFTRPADARQLWREQRLAVADRPRALAVADFDGDGREDVAAAGAVWRQQKAGEFQREPLPAFEGALAAWAMDVNGDRRIDLVALTASGLVWFENAPIQ